MEKPKKRYPVDEMLNWIEVQDYIELKYGRNLRNWAKKTYDAVGKDIPHQDFWHWLIDYYPEIRNGSRFFLDCAEYIENCGDEIEPWVKEILEIILKEFPEKEYGHDLGGYEFWVEW